MTHKEILSGVAIVMTLLAFAPYIMSVLSGRTKAHAFSWIIWGSTTFLAAMAQFADGGGAGALPIAISGTITLFVAGLAYVKRSDLTITKLDWVFLAAAFSALPAWFFTSDPVWASAILTAVDLIGFGPTIRKVRTAPYEEHLGFYWWIGVRNCTAIAALENYSATTILFPGVMAAASFVFIAWVLMLRRRAPAA